jgi:ABC-type nitrate/sulfonate/bicarbonate transport system substrate-binding protein
MNKRLLFWIACVVFLFCPPARQAQAAAARTAVITFGSFSEREVALFVARDYEFFRRQGIDAKLVHVRSGPVSLSALAAGESQFYNGSVTGAILGAVANGLDIVYVGSLIKKLTGTIVVNPAIKTPAGLRGKNIGVQSIGGGVWMFTMLALDHWGLDVKKDNLKLRVIGDEPVLAQAIASNVIDGSYLGYTFASQMEKQGFRVLADLAKLPIPFQGTALMTRRGFAKSSPEMVESMLRALKESVAFIVDPANKAAVTKSLAKGLRLARPEDAAEGYDRVVTLYDQNQELNVEGIRNTIRLVCTVNENICGLKAENLVDERFLKRIR